jgi:hypothetical protein
MTSRVEITMTEMGELGIPSRMGRLHPRPGESAWEAVVAELREKGCGGWRGRTACGDPPRLPLCSAIDMPGLYGRSPATCHARFVELRSASFGSSFVASVWLIWKTSPGS